MNDHEVSNLGEVVNGFCEVSGFDEVSGFCEVSLENDHARGCPGYHVLLENGF